MDGIVNLKQAIKLTVRAAPVLPKNGIMALV